MKLIAEWKQAWRWSSMHAMTAALAIQGALLGIPESWQAAIHPLVGHVITGFLLLAGIVGRLVDQAPKPDPTDQAGA